MFPERKKTNYLITGAFNTFFGYVFGVGILYTLHGYVNILILGIIINITCISFSFITYKIFVFKTKGNWLVEYFRCYLVYGGVAILGIGVLWVLVDFFKTPYWLAQGGVIAITVIVSYMGHSKFTFQSIKKS